MKSTNCQWLKQAAGAAEGNVRNLEAKLFRARQEAKRAVEKVNRSVGKAGEEFFKSGVGFAAGLAPYGSLMSKIMKIPDTLESQEKTSRRVEQHSRDHALLASQAEYAAQQVNEIQAELEEARRILEQTKADLAECMS